MLDRKTESVLFTIVNKCNGKYKILDSDDFETTENIDSHLNFLCTGGYVVMQYSSGNEYLVMPTAKGNEYFTDKNQNLTLRAVLCKSTKKSAFWGAFSGTIILQMVFILIYLAVIKNG